MFFSIVRLLIDILCFMALNVILNDNNKIQQKSNELFISFSSILLSFFIFVFQFRYLPQKNVCSFHSSPNVKLTNDCYNNNKPLRSNPQYTHFDAFNHHVPFTRNASTSTLDFDNDANDGDYVSGKSNHRMMKDKSGNSNKLDFNNICGMMRSNKPKECNSNMNVYQRMKPAKNIYYIKDQNDDEEPNIFIVDPKFYKNRKCALQKSLEDIRMQKLNNTYSRHHHRDACNGWNLMDRGCYASKTLPRDFSRPKHTRPSLGNVLDDFYHHNGTNENR